MLSEIICCRYSLQTPRHGDFDEYATCIMVIKIRKYQNKKFLLKKKVPYIQLLEYNKIFWINQLGSLIAYV